MLERARSFKLIANFQRRLDNGTISNNYRRLHHKQTNERIHIDITHSNQSRNRKKNKRNIFWTTDKVIACFNGNLINFVCQKFNKIVRCIHSLTTNSFHFDYVCSVNMVNIMFPLSACVHLRAHSSEISNSNYLAYQAKTSRMQINVIWANPFGYLCCTKLIPTQLKM